MKIVLLEFSDTLFNLFGVEVGRFKGSLFHMEKDDSNTYWDVLYIVGIAALLKT